MAVPKMSSRVKNYNPFRSYVLGRIKNNKNCIIIIVGGTGSGKSYSALFLGEMFDPLRKVRGKQLGFDINRVSFHANEFLSLVQQSLPKGSVIIFDEAGIDMDNRSFMSFLNKTLAGVMQTVRYKRHIIILTVPELDFIDKKVRNLAHLVLMTYGINKKEKYCKLKPYLVSTSKIKRKGQEHTYMPHPTIDDFDEGLLKIGSIKVPLPSEKIRKAYENKKAEFGAELYGEAQEMLNKNQIAGNKLSPRERTIYESTRCGADVKNIMKATGIKSKQAIYNIRNRIREKGFDI